LVFKKNDNRPPSIIRNLNVYPGKTGDNFDQDQLTATWLASLEGESVKYVAEISKTSNFTTILETKTDIDGLSYSFLGLDSDTRYYIRIKGVNDFGESEWYPSPPHYSVKTLNPVASIPQVDFRVPDPEHHIIYLDWNELIDDFYTFKYTLIRDYIDGVNAREYVLFRSKTYTEAQSLKTDTLNLVSGDDHTYRLIVQFLDGINIVATVTYTKQATVPNPSDPTHDDGTGEKIIFRLSSGGSGFIAQILLESGFDGIYWERSLQSDIDSEGHFTYRAADGFVYRSAFESDDTEILKSIDFNANPGETYYVHYKLFNFPDNPNNYSVWSQTKSLTVAAASKPEISRLRAFDESDSRIRLTVNSDNASADNQQTLTIKRSLDGIDFTDIHTQLVSSSS
jgi:hypothetical protein